MLNTRAREIVRRFKSGLPQEFEHGVKRAKQSPGMQNPGLAVMEDRK
ncbi:MAG: hypothetical protein LBM98_03325 [Oscillospiraceae bacterium]|jgi:hypothetical protein|nr:hypothetical protein [Oscillospiraceae bacterium]